MRHVWTPYRLLSQRPTLAGRSFWMAFRRGWLGLAVALPAALPLMADDEGHDAEVAEDVQVVVEVEQEADAEPQADAQVKVDEDREEASQRRSTRSRDARETKARGDRGRASQRDARSERRIQIVDGRVVPPNAPHAPNAPHPPMPPMPPFQVMPPWMQIEQGGWQAKLKEYQDHQAQKMDRLKDRMRAAMTERGVDAKVADAVLDEVSDELKNSLQGQFNFVERTTVQPLSRFRVGVMCGPAEGRDGLEVLRVLPGSSAAEAGLEQGDVIVSVDDQAIQESEDLIAAVQRAGEAKSALVVKILRGDEEIVKSLTPMAGAQVEWNSKFQEGAPDPKEWTEESKSISGWVMDADDAQRLSQLQDEVMRKIEAAKIDGQRLAEDAQREAEALAKQAQAKAEEAAAIAKKAAEEVAAEIQRTVKSQLKDWTQSDNPAKESEAKDLRREIESLRGELLELRKMLEASKR